MTLEICQVDFEQKTITGLGFLSTFTRFARAKIIAVEITNCFFCYVTGDQALTHIDIFGDFNKSWKPFQRN